MADSSLTLDAPHPLLVTCERGLAPWLRTELEGLGFTGVCEHRTGANLTGTLRDCLRMNLQLRTAYNVLLELKTCRCETADDLYREMRELPWEDWIDPSQYFSVVSRVDTPAIDNSMFASLRVKDAVVDRIFKHRGARPDSGPDRHRLVLHLYWKGTNARLYLNTSGRKLSDRGYRKQPHKAPLRESLAAAVMMATGYDGTQPLVCPMAGSGTLAIEGALLALQRPPGLLRDHFGALHLKDFDHEAWEAMRRDARQQASKADLAPIIVSDNDPDAIEAARANAQTAGVDGRMAFHVCDFAETPVPPGDGIVILNPAYGKRMGERKDLAPVYGRIGDWFKQQCAGYTGYVFTGNRELAKRIGLRPRRKQIFWNAKIECRLFDYELYAGSRR